MFTRSDSSTFSNKWYSLCIRVAAMNSLFSLLLIFLVFEPNLAATSDKQKERKNPRLISLFPQGSHQGSFFDTTVRGEGLEGVQTVWFDCNHLTGQVREVSQFFIQKSRFSKRWEDPGQEILIRIKISPQAAIGVHELRLITDWGISNPLSLVVSSEVNTFEKDDFHGTASTAQSIAVPVNLNGKIANHGEMDFYEFSTSKDEKLQFEVLTTGGVLPGSPINLQSPEIILYRPTGSWFDSQKVTRMEVLDESTFLPLPVEGKVLRPRLKHRFTQSGRYLVSVGNVTNKGGAGHAYQLRISKSVPGNPSKMREWTELKQAHVPDFFHWEERSFARKISTDRHNQLWSRTGQLSKVLPNGKLPLENTDQVSIGQKFEKLQWIMDEEPKSSQEQAIPLSLPTVIEGSINQPGDVDYFTFPVEMEQGLAFEIETTKQMEPGLSLLLEVLDSKGQRVCSNIYRIVENNSAFWNKFLRPKTIFTFQKKGTYFLRLQDLTSRLGGEEFSYRVLVRSQVPHIGKITLGTLDHVNLVPGEVKKITVTIEKEEAFDHLVVLGFENLPSGISALPSLTEKAKTSVRDEGPRGGIQKDQFFPQTQKVTFSLMVEKGVRPSSMPHQVRIVARGVVKGHPGILLPVKDIHLMVIDPNSTSVVSRLELGE